jgi:hypothetical protein
MLLTSATNTLANYSVTFFNKAVISEIIYTALAWVIFLISDLVAFLRFACLPSSVLQWDASYFVWLSSPSRTDAHGKGCRHTDTGGSNWTCYVTWRLTTAFHNITWHSFFNEVSVRTEHTVGPRVHSLCYQQGGLLNSRLKTRKHNLGTFCAPLRPPGFL